MSDPGQPTVGTDQTVVWTRPAGAPTLEGGPRDPNESTLYPSYPCHCGRGPKGYCPTHTRPSHTSRLGLDRATRGG